MAKITPKGKTVTGTKKKDKIVHTGKGAWKTTLTVNAGAGNDLINFKKSKYKNKIYGEAGKDTIYGGKKNDKIYGGKGNDTITGGNGNYTIYGEQGRDTIDVGNGKNLVSDMILKNIAYKDSNELFNNIGFEPRANVEKLLEQIDENSLDIKYQEDVKRLKLGLRKGHK